MLQAAIESVLPSVSDEAAAELIRALYESHGRPEFHADDAVPDAEEERAHERPPRCSAGDAGRGVT